MKAKEIGMAIIVFPAKPKSLLAARKKAIDYGKINTWEYGSDGDFTHKPKQ
jgi:hypothetical protein